MNYDYQVMKPEHIDSVIDCVYEAWKDNAWFQKASEQVIKQSLFDRINHYGVMEKTLVCIKKDDGKIVGVLFGQNAQTYLENNMKWNFHPHFEVIEKFIKLVLDQMQEKGYDLNASIWPYWLSSNIPNSKMAEFLMILTSYIHIQQGYKYHLAFTNHAKSRHLTGKYQVNYTEPIELKNLQGADFQKNITLYPYVADLNGAFKKFNTTLQKVVDMYPKL